MDNSKKTISKVLLSGNEAIARGAYEAGVAVSTAYPGTPSSEISPAIAAYGTAKVEWSVNEKVALEVAIGSSFCGARSICSMKHVGLNVASDPLLTVTYTGVKGGLVIISADDPGMHSSQNEQDNRHYGRFAKIPVLEPSDSQEAKDFTKLAFSISEQFDTPVIVRMTTRVCHAKTIVELSEPETMERKYSFEKNPHKYVMVPAFAKKRHVIIEDRLNKLKEFSESTELNRIEYGIDKNTGIICSGITYQYVKESFPDVSILKLGFVYPLCESKISEFCESVKNVYVIEELDNFLYTEIKAKGINVLSKPDKFMLDELNPDKVHEILTGEPKEKISNIPPKPPAMCPGCTHRGVFHTLKKMKFTVVGDIGCYTLGSLPPLSSLDTCVCMGASIGMLHGMTKVLPEKEKQNVAAVIGDSTFFHSGITGLIDIVYNKGIGTILILDNQTTAMTGKQEHPGTGFTINLEPTVSILPEKICEAIGIKNIKVVDPYDLKSIQGALTESLNSSEVSVIVFRRECVLKGKKKKASYAYIIADKCVNCRQCLNIGCPAISNTTPPVINMALCNGCGVCIQICKTGAIECKKI